MPDSTTPATVLRHVRLDDLIATIRTVHDDPLDQLSDAMTAAQHLGDVADHLIGHFVDQARRAGASWTEIGTSMGVSKQAAQKRFVARAPDTAESADDASNPFGRFTPRARNVVVEAHNLAVAEHAAAVTPEHLARGLAVAPESVAELALRARGVALADLVAACAPAPTPAAEVADETTVVPYDDRSRAVLENTATTAISLGHNFIGTEHLLLALFSDPQMDQTLRELGTTADDIRETVTALLDQFTE